LKSDDTFEAENKFDEHFKTNNLGENIEKNLRKYDTPSPKKINNTNKLQESNISDFSVNSYALSPSGTKFCCRVCLSGSY
jgi:hypothetical protein